MAEKTFARIAHPTDLSKDSEFAFYHALRLALAGQARLDILNVDEAAHTRNTEEFPQADRTLGAWGMSPNGFLDRVRTIATYGREPVDPILGYIDEALPDLLVLATHRRHGLDRLVHKEVAQKLAQHGGSPTLFVPIGEEGFVSPSNGEVHLRRILLPVDWLPAPQVGADTTAALLDLLRCSDVELTLLHVGETTRDFPSVNVPTRPGWRWMQKTREGSVVDAIVEVANDLDADLVVMVTKGREGFLDALRGSTTELVLQRVACPLLAVPAMDAA